MRQISVAEFKEQCLSLVEQVGPDGIIITKRGKPVAKLIPIGSEGESLIGALKGKIVIKGDLVSTGVRWV